MERLGVPRPASSSRYPLDPALYPAPEGGADAGAVLVLVASLAPGANGVTQVQPDWMPAAVLAGRSDHAMAYDAARQRVVLFGGLGPSRSLLSDTWEWDGTSWVRRSPTNGPGARSGHAMAYDAARQRVVLFGGWDGDYARFGDTWEWDGSNWTRQSTTQNPGRLMRPAMAYDLVAARTVLLGAETWLYGALAPATSQTLGNACAGSNGPPVLTSNDAYLGTPAFRLQLLSARPVAPYLFALAVTPDNLALGGGCTLYVKSPFVPWVGVTDGAGFAESPPVAIPFDVSLRGMAFYAQAVVADPQGPVSGLAFSAGRKLVLGD